MEDSPPRNSRKDMRVMEPGPLQLPCMLLLAHLRYMQTAWSRLRRDPDGLVLPEDIWATYLPRLAACGNGRLTLACGVRIICHTLSRLTCAVHVFYPLGRS